MANGIRKLDKNKISGSGIKRRLDPDKIHVDTAYVYKLQNDVSEKRLRRLNESLEKIRSGWQDKETMEKTRKELSSVRESIDRYNNFLSLSGSKNGNDRLNALSNAYGQMLEDFDSYASTYREAEDYVRGQKSKFVGAAREEYVAKASADLVKEWQKEAKAYYDKWGHLAEEADFDEYVKKGEAKTADPDEYLRQFGMPSTDPVRWLTGTRDRDDTYTLVAKGFSDMTEDEKKIYNYLLGKEGAEYANEFLADIESNLDTRGGARQAQKILDIENPLLRGAATIGAATAQGASGALVNPGKYFWSEEDTKAVNPANVAEQVVLENSDPITRILADTGSNIGNMLPYMALGGAASALGAKHGMAANAAAKFGQTVGAAGLGAGAAGDAYQRGITQYGLSEDQARLYGAAVGLSEATLQKAIGGISAFGGIDESKLIAKADMINNAALRVAAKLGIKIGAEEIEEMSQNYLEPLFRKVISGEEYDAPTLAENIETAIVTALSTGVLEGGGTISNDIRETALQNARLDMRYSGQEDAFNAALTQVLGQERAAEMLEGTYLPSKKEVETARGIAEADSAQTSETLNEYARALAQDESEVNPESRELKRLQQSIDSGRVSGKQIDRMVNQRENRRNVQDAAAPALHDKEVIQAAAENRLAELGETYDAAAIAEAVARQVAGEKLTRQERRTLENSEYGVRVANEMNPANVGTGEYSNAYVEGLEPTQFYRPFSKGFPPQSAIADSSPLRGGSLIGEGVATTDNILPRGEDLTEQEANRGLDSSGISEEPHEFEASADGKTVITDTGETVQIAEIASIKNGKMKLRLQSGEEIDAEDVSYASPGEALLYETALNMGTNAAVANALIQNYRPEDGVSADIYALGAEEAYRYGRYGIPAEEMSTRGFSAVLTQAQRAFAYGLGQSDRRSIAEQEQAEVQKKKAAAAGKGRDAREKRGTVTFEKGVQAVTERQKVSVAALEKLAEILGVDFHLFASEADAEGRRVGANGWYENGVIYLDMHAGIKGEDTILFTAAHELTHFIREWSPAKFKTFADFLFAEYGKKGVSVDALIERQIKKAKETGRSISYGTAYEEVVADSCETMLADGRAVEKLARLKAQDKNLWEKIRDFIRELAAKIRAVYEGLSPDSPEGRYVAQMRDAADRLQDMFTEALADAGEAYRTAGKGSIAGDRAAKFQTRYADGERIVWIEDNVLRENTNKLPTHQYIANYIAEHIGEVYTILESGQKVYIGKDLPSEYTQSKYTKQILRSRPGVLKIKHRSVAGIGEMIEIATNRRWEKTRHPESKDAKFGMYRYDTKVGFPVKDRNGDTTGANVYTAELIIRNASDGKKYLYDIVNIKKDIVKSDWLTQRTTRAAEKTAARRDNAFGNSIRNKSKNVKEYSENKESAKKYSIREAFADEYDKWDKKNPRTVFNVGTTSEVLKDLGIPDTSILWDASKIIKIKSKHPEMTDTIIKQVPQILENPIIVMKSKTSSGRITLFGEVFSNNKPILAVLELNPTGRNGVRLDELKIASAYGKDNAQRFIDSSQMLYKDSNKKRISNWERRTGLQLPVGTFITDSNSIVTQESQSVNIQSMQSDAKKYSVREAFADEVAGNYDYSKPFAQQIKDYMAGKIPKGDTLIIGETPQVFQKLGFNALPMTINTTHVDYALYGTKDVNHSLGQSLLNQLPAALETPAAVISSQTQTNTSLVVLLPIQHRGSTVIAPVYIDGTGYQNGIRIDSNAITSVFGKNNAVTKLLYDAIGEEKKGNIAVYYYNKKIADPLLQSAGLQLPGSLIPHGGYIHSIREKNSPVKPKLKNVTYSQQFKRWFGDWKKHPNTACKIVNKDGTPQIMFHGTPAANGDFTVFDSSRAAKKGGMGFKALGEGNYFTSSNKGGERYAKNGGRVLECYLNIKKPYEVSGDIIAKIENDYGEKLNGSKEITPFLKKHGYDGVIMRDKAGNITLAVAYYPSQIKSAIDNIGTFDSANPDIRYSMRDYSYEALTEKPDVQVTTLSEDVPKNRADVVYEAKKNAAKIGKRNKDGSVTVHVKDIDRDIVLGTRGLQHGLDRRFDINAPVALQAGEILQNSIQINEMNPEKAEANSSYVLIGAAQNENGQLYIVRSVVNGYKSELASMDVLYAMNAKTEADLQIQKENRLGDYPRGGQHKGSSPSGSTISIAELLDSVNRYFPDILPEDVLRHYGHTERPAGRLGESALYSMRDPQQAAEWEEVREILTEENRKLREDNENLQQLVELQQKVAHGTKITKSSVEVAAKALKKEANATGNTAQLSALLTEFYGHISDGIDLSSENAAQAVRPVVDWLISNSKAESAVLSPELERQKLIAEVYDSYWRVSTLQEAAQPIQRDINRLKMKHRESMERLRATHREHVAELQESYKEKTAQLRREHRADVLRRQQEITDKYRQSRQKGIESRRKTAMRQKIKRAFSELNHLLLHGTKERNIKIGLQKTVAELLDIVNMDTVDAQRRVAEYDALIAAETDPAKIEKLTESRNRIRLQGERLGERLAAFKAEYTKIKESEDPLIANAHDEVIEAQIESVQSLIGDTPLRNMSLEQLTAVYELFQAVRTSVKNANRAFVMNKEEGIAQQAEAIEREIQKTGENKAAELKKFSKIKQFSWDMLKPVYAFRAMGSPVFEQAFWKLQEAEGGWAADYGEARDFFANACRTYGYNSWDLKEKRTFRSADGRNFSMDLLERMDFYLASRREQGRKHLLQRGFGFETDVEVVKKAGVPIEYDKTLKETYMATEELIDKIGGTLTQEQKQFAENLQQYLAKEIGQKLDEVSLELYGIKKYGETGYWPLTVMREFVETLNEQAANQSPLIKNRSFTKALNENASSPILIGKVTDIWARHVFEACNYHNFTLPLEDFRRVFNYKAERGTYSSVEKALREAYGTGPVEYLKRLYLDLNGGPTNQDGAMGIDKFMSLAKRAAVMASASVVIQQPSSILRATAYISPKYFAAAIPGGFNWAKHNEKWNECKKYAPVARIKEMGYFDMGMGSGSTAWLTAKEYDRMREKAWALFKDGTYRDEVLSKAPAMADELTWVYLWEAVKKETEAKTGLRPGSEELLQAAGKRFTEVVALTQVYDSTLSRSGLMRKRDTGWKAATAFMGEPTVTENMFVDAVIHGKRTGGLKGAKIIADTAGAILSSVLLNSVLKSIVTAGRDDDEDETYLEKYFGELTGNFFNDINPLTYIPWGRDILSLLQGYSVDRMDMTVFADLIKSIRAMDSDSKTQEEKIVGLAGSISTFFGIPLKNVTRDINAFLNTVRSFKSGNKTTKAGIKMSIEEEITGEEFSNAERIYTYYSSGEVSEVTYMVDDMMQKGLDSGKSEDEARSSIRSSMTSLLKPMYLVAYIAKDEDEMKKIRMLMQKTGVYGTVGDIIGDCKKWIKDLEDEEKTKKAIDKVKEGDLYESDIDVEKAYGKLLKSLAS